MNLYEEIEKIKAQGYNEANAQSKLGQDIVLKAIYMLRIAMEQSAEDLGCKADDFTKTCNVRHK